MRRSALVTAASGVAAMTALAGCGAAQTAPTAQDLPSVPGVNVAQDGITVRNAVVVFDPDGYDQGDAATLRMALVNRTQDEVTLTGAGSPVGQPVTVTEAIEIGAPQAPAQPDVIPDDEEGQTGQAPGDTGGQQPDVTLPAGSLTQVTLEIETLNEPVHGATAVPLELSFDNDVTIAVTLTMEPPLEPLPRDEDQRNPEVRW